MSLYPAVTSSLGEGGGVSKLPFVGVYRLNSQIQDYDWGSKSAIAELTGRKATGKSEAELWMGAHPRCPSLLVGEEGGASDLASLLAQDPKALLGEEVAARFSGLPFLIKVLAAARPLSLQAHPNQSQAKEGFAREEAAGISISAGHRNYKDASHKPELIFALSEFWALSGFRDFGEASTLIRAFVPDAEGSFVELLVNFENDSSEEGLRRFFQGLFLLAVEEREALVSQAARSAAGESLSGEAARVAPWLRRLAEQYPADPGVIASLLLNLVCLAPGEAMYLPAGNLHAYLSGLALEIMASSDNVLRGGLTRKHVDLQELSSVLLFQPFVPSVQSGARQEFPAGSCTRFITEAPEFELSIVELEGGHFESAGPEIWFLLSGELSVSSLSEPFKQGEQIFLSAGGRVEARGRGRFARASLGVF